MIALIDFDVLRYSIGFAAEKKDPETGTIIVEPFSHVIRMLDNKVSEVMSATGASRLRGYLSGGLNFRTDIAVTKPYKGHRPDRKPVHYDELTSFITDNFDVEVVTGAEADDAMGVEQVKDGDLATVICTIDKDLNMIPGWHYNWNKGCKYYVDDWSADMWFWVQMLTGDAADNIPGVPKIGPVTAGKLLMPCSTNKECYEVIHNEYKKAYGVNDYEDVIEEQAQLLWIKRSWDLSWKEELGL